MRGIFFMRSYIQRLVEKSFLLWESFFRIFLRMCCPFVIATKGPKSLALIFQNGHPGYEGYDGNYENPGSEEFEERSYHYFVR